MKKFFYLAAVLPMLLVACEKEATVNTLTATATVAGDNDTKTTYTDNGTVSIDFSGQDGTLENLSKYDVMTCTSTTEAGALKFAFEHKCAIIRVKLTSDNAASATKNHLCIKFGKAKIKSGVSNKTASSTNVSTGSSSGISTTSSGLQLDVYFDGPISNGQNKTIYVAVPPMDYNSSVNYASFIGYQYSVNVSSTKTIDAGKLYDISIAYQNGYATTSDPD